MISNKHKGIFVHIPKNGGTSLKAKFSDLEGEYHLPAKILKNRYSGKWDNYYTFTFVRNPFDRLVSIFHYYRDNNESTNKHIKQIMLKTFKEFCINYISDTPQKWTTGWLGGEYMLQKNWVTNDKGEIIVDFIGCFENYTEDSKIILDRFGITHNIQHLRRSNHKPYQEYYDDELRELVEGKLKEDLEFFNYKF